MSATPPGADGTVTLSGLLGNAAPCAQALLLEAQSTETPAIAKAARRVLLIWCMSCLRYVLSPQILRRGLLRRIMVEIGLEIGSRSGHGSAVLDSRFESIDLSSAFDTMLTMQTQLWIDRLSLFTYRLTGYALEMLMDDAAMLALVFC
jgi:hypothetical protein